MSLQLRRKTLGVLLFLPLATHTISGCGSSTDYGGGSGFPTPTGADVIMVRNAQSKTTTAFSPNPFNVSLGGGASVTVTFGNDDNVTHDVVEDGGSPSFDSPAIAKGTIFSHDFTAAGDYTYHCEIHPGMVGTISVTP